MFVGVLAVSALLSFAEARSARPAVDCSAVENSKPAFDRTTKKFKGCRLYKVQAGSVNEALGLKVGDIVEAANTTKGGHKLESIKGQIKTTDNIDRE